MIYITGDTHGEMERIKAAKLKKRDTLIILGDFGFLWNGGPEEEKQLAALGKHKGQILFLDGTHENFDLLNAYPVVEFAGGHARHLGGSLYQLLRGEVYTIEGKTIFAFGGGTSDDLFERQEAGRWWAAEKPTKQDYENADKNLAAMDGKVDVILTHEPGFQLCQILKVGESVPSDLAVYLDKLQNTVEFGQWYFGKWHLDKYIPLRYHAVFKGIYPLEEKKKAHHAG